VGRQLEYAVCFSYSCYAAIECFHSHEIQQGARSIRTVARMELAQYGDSMRYLSRIPCLHTGYGMLAFTLHQLIYAY